MNLKQSGRMTPTTRLDIPVEIRVNGGVYEGFLEHWRRRGDCWQGYCRWTQAPGEQYIRWLDQDDIRRLDE